MFSRDRAAAGLAAATAFATTALGFATAFLTTVAGFGVEAGFLACAFFEAFLTTFLAGFFATALFATFPVFFVAVFFDFFAAVLLFVARFRSEERRVGKECS